MSWSQIRHTLEVGEIHTAAGRALVEERYLALRNQVPVIYVLAAVNLAALQITTSGSLAFGFNLPSLLTVCAIVRTVQWLKSNGNPSHAIMLRRLRQSCWFAALLCFAVSLWCLYLLETAPSETHLAIVLYGGFTAVGVAFGLSAVPLAACIPLLVLGLPLAGVSFMSPNPKFVGAAVSLAVATLMILQLLARQSAQFTSVVTSRSMIGRQQELTEHARQEALVASTTDFLTGLPNRRAFVSALDAQILQEGQPSAVAVIDVDRFKTVNDTYGHCCGDELLRTVGRRLVKAAGRDGLVARLGGDEFALLLRDVATPAQAQEVGRKLLAQVNRPTTINRRQFAISASCGIAIARETTATSPSRVLTDADIALYESKSQANGKVVVFAPEMEAPRHRRAQIERALQLPGVFNDIHLVFQPIVDLASGRVVANEALARWRDRELGHVSPAEFVPIAEQLNVIGGISDRLMARAFAEAALWSPTIRLSFNLSAVQLCSADLANKILAALESADIAPSRLQLEVTETALFADFEQARKNLAELRYSGVTVVLDDFGAGYASLGYLREFQFDQIKLDGALVTAAVNGGDGECLLGAVIGLCRALGVSVVAEHVESEQQWSMLLKLGCTLGQGFWLQRPLSVDEARRRSSPTAAGEVVLAPLTRRSAA